VFDERAIFLEAVERIELQGTLRVCTEPPASPAATT
jgi:hypothetical protein